MKLAILILLFVALSYEVWWPVVRRVLAWVQLPAMILFLAAMLVSLMFSRVGRGLLLILAMVCWLVYDAYKTR